MDIKTLSQQLNMSVRELQQKIREAGFKVSPRARKINNILARRILEKLSSKPKALENAVIIPAKVKIPPFIAVKEFAAKINQSVTNVIKKLLENGVMATINEEIDADTASIIAEEFGVEIEAERQDQGTKLGLGYVVEVLAKEDQTKLEPRPPIVAIMGHVDHGKTTLLDTIRKTNVVAFEAGAITQHIGAYQVDFAGRKITFLDTPGHEAFAAMRARGANVTDIIVLVVAADDSVKPQTAEVINRAKLTRTPLVVAINKIDKPDANIERVKSDLASLGITVEDWGGTVPAIPISAKTGQGIDKLLEIILLTAEIEELKANFQGVTVGTVIDSHLAHGLGVAATVLVQNGTLKVGEPVVVGTAYGKIRTMEDANGKKLKIANPSTPVIISGLSDLPEVGDILKVVGQLEEAKEMALNFQKLERARRFQAARIRIRTSPDQKELKLIIRADVQGSLEAITDALSRFENEEVKLTMVDQGAGEITESDVLLAENTGSTIIGFHVAVSPRVAKLAKQKNVTVDVYDIIYELMEDVTSALLAMMSPELMENKLGRAKIKALFRTEKEFMIVGGEVIEGRILDKKKFRVFRNQEQVAEGKIEELQQNKIEVEEVKAPSEFGIKVKVSAPIQEGDILEIFDETVKKKELKT